MNYFQYLASWSYITNGRTST